MKPALLLAILALTGCSLIDGRPAPVNVRFYGSATVQQFYQARYDHAMKTVAWRDAANRKDLADLERELTDAMASQRIKPDEAAYLSGLREQVRKTP